MVLPFTISHQTTTVLINFNIDVREGVGDRDKRSDFLQSVSRKHFITKQDVRNIRSKVKDPLIMRHKHDPTSVSQLLHIIWLGKSILLHHNCTPGIPLCGRATARNVQSGVDLQAPRRVQFNPFFPTIRIICSSSTDRVSTRSVPKIRFISTLYRFNPRHKCLQL